MELGVDGKVAIVLAASKGLGRAAAHALAAEGAKVAIAARDAGTLERSAEELRRATGATILAAPLDVVDAPAAETFVARVVRELGPVAILVNNAGGPPFGTFDEFDDARWRAAFEQNLLAQVRWMRLVLPSMRAQRWGRIVNVISFSVKSVLARSVLSTALRAGVVGTAKLLADEVAADGITVNNVAPGQILTDRIREARLAPELAKGRAEDDVLRELAAAIPARRLGRPDELGALVAFLCSERAAYINGATIPIDGAAGRSVL